jgi:uncharacterized protein YndB with AHSA1/START domain
MPTNSATTPADGLLETAGERSTLRFQRHLAHPIERVWAALTEPARLLDWWGDAQIDLVEGGRFTLRWLNTDAQGNGVTLRAVITRLEPPHLLETRGEPHGTLRWELQPDATGTTLTFSSTLDLPAAYRSMNLAGWHYHLDALAAALDGRSTDLVNLPNDRWEALNRQYLAQLA